MVKISQFLNRYKPVILLICLLSIFFIPFATRTIDHAVSLADYITILGDMDYYLEIYHMPGMTDFISLQTLIFVTILPSCLGIILIAIFVYCFIHLIVKKLNSKIYLLPYIAFIVCGILVILISRITPPTHYMPYFLKKIKLHYCFYIAMVLYPLIYCLYTAIQLFCYSRCVNVKPSKSDRIAELEKQVAELKDSQNNKS